MKTITATFIGEDSLGYTKGRTYNLRVWSGRRPGVLSSMTMNFVQDYPITIARSTQSSRYDGGGLCPYSNIETFLENWNDIRSGYIEEGSK